MMRTIDFSRSFLTFRIDSLKKPPTTASHKPVYTLNNARIPIECRCMITDKRSDEKQDFVLGVDCKTERVGVDRDIWTEPNADFVPVMSQTRFLNIKTFDRAGKQVSLFPSSLGMQPERQIGDIQQAFDSVKIEVCECDGEILETNRDIVNAVLDNRVLVGRTVIWSETYSALIEYPMKTINANERDDIYQPDTGPVLFPDLACEFENLIGGLELAFLAYNTPNWVEFLVRVPTKVTDDVEVYHYSRTVRMDARNTIIMRM